MLLKRGVPLYTHFWPNCLTFGEVVEDVEDVKGSATVLVNLVWSSLSSVQSDLR